ncbi:hypothetical protein SAMN05443661_110159 [Natronobacterium gregoryi]|uniref:Uncharacterized protein n=2 Tax=Natronobacterium gregoryi TaxID=44930 RepID=L0AL70_NATGS|nr:hypothetical protein Natgr_3427 [Natronobacterium gregoryi SP2]SFI96527.1 hypothetical protein SAMN05443661_110159 [Natronobacterium gregoryi]
MRAVVMAAPATIGQVVGIVVPALLVDVMFFGMIGRMTAVGAVVTHRDRHL